MTLKLRSASSGKSVIIAYSEAAVDFLIRNGVSPESKDSARVVFCVEDPYAVYHQLQRAKII